MVARIALAAVAVLAAAPGRSSASVYTVGARTEVELYDFRSIAGHAPEDPFTIQRQRLVQYLQLGAFDLGSRGPDERIDFVTSLRLDEDFGLDARERELLDLTQPQIDLLYGYLQWRGALGGLLDARLGRQVVLREIEFWSFDGLEATVHVPHVPLSLTALGGLLVTGSSPLGSANMGPDGVRVSDRRRIEQGATTWLMDETASSIAYDYLDAPTPVFGGRLDLEGVRSVSAGIGYRRALSQTSGENPEQTPEAVRGWHTDLEHLTADARWRPLQRLEIEAAGDHDLVRRRPAAVLARVRYDVIPYRLAASLQWSLHNPSFDSDSIWNVFATGARQEWRLQADVSPGGAVRYTAGLLATAFSTDLTSGFEDADATDWVPGAFASASTKPGRRIRLGVNASFRGVPGAEATGDYRYLGREVFLAGLAGYDLVAGWNALDLRLSVANVDDPTQPALRDLWSTSAALLSRNRITEEAELLLIGEGAVNRYSQPDLRAYAALQLQADFQ